MPAGDGCEGKRQVTDWARDEQIRREEQDRLLRAQEFAAEAARSDQERQRRAMESAADAARQAEQARVRQAQESAAEENRRADVERARREQEHADDANQAAAQDLNDPQYGLFARLSKGHRQEVEATERMRQQAAEEDLRRQELAARSAEQILPRPDDIPRRLDMPDEELFSRPEDVARAAQQDLVALAGRPLETPTPQDEYDKDSRGIDEQERERLRRDEELRPEWPPPPPPQPAEPRDRQMDLVTSVQETPDKLWHRDHLREFILDQEWVLREIAQDAKFKEWKYWNDPVNGFFARMRRDDEHNLFLIEEEKFKEKLNEAYKFIRDRHEQQAEAALRVHEARHASAARGWDPRPLKPVPETDAWMASLGVKQVDLPNLEEGGDRALFEVYVDEDKLKKLLEEIQKDPTERRPERVCKWLGRIPENSWEAAARGRQLADHWYTGNDKESDVKMFKVVVVLDDESTQCWMSKIGSQRGHPAVGSEQRSQPARAEGVFYRRETADGYENVVARCHQYYRPDGFRVRLATDEENRWLPQVEEVATLNPQPDVEQRPR